MASNNATFLIPIYINNYTRIFDLISINVGDQFITHLKVGDIIACYGIGSISQPAKIDGIATNISNDIYGLTRLVTDTTGASYGGFVGGLKCYEESDIIITYGSAKGSTVVYPNRPIPE